MPKESTMESFVTFELACYLSLRDAFGTERDMWNRNKSHPLDPDSSKREKNHKQEVRNVSDFRIRILFFLDPIPTLREDDVYNVRERLQ